MSLQLAAQHLAAQGRGPDKQLVHMSPREVAGLQALAMAHGGSLSVNPKTGLPEAGFLDNLLPTIIGAGLMYATGGAAAGALTPGMIGLGVGALQTARTGSLEKGLMAGLGAYGGAGLFAGLAGAGAAGAGAAGAGAGAAQAAGPGLTVANQAAPQIAAEQLAAQTAAAPGITVAPELSMGAGATYPPIDPYSQFAPTSTQYGAFGEAPITSTPPAYDRLSARFPALDAQMPLRAGETFIPGIGEASPALSSAVGGQGTVLAPATPAAVTSAQDAAFKQAAINQDAAGAMAAKGPSTVAERFAAMPTKDKFKYGLAALSPALLAQPEYKAPELDREQYRYAYTPGRVANPEESYTGALTGERTYFRPSYTRLAAGGPVEAMSAANVYAMQNARGGVSDMGIDNSTGMQKMAVGGAAGLSGYEGYKGYSQPGQSQYKYAYDPKTQSYREVAPAVSLANVAAAAPLFVETGGYGGGDMGQGYGEGFGATSGQLGPGASQAEADAIGAAQAAAADAAAADAGAAAGAAAGDGLGYGSGGYDGGGDGSGGFYAKGGGISDLGDYSDGGRLLRGPGDGVSDSIPAMIGRKQPARLADGEFVVPARIVSELGNGSTEAGARKLYAMMDRIQKARGKTVGKGKVAKNSKAEKYLPA